VKMRNTETTETQRNYTQGAQRKCKCRRRNWNTKCFAPLGS